MGIGCHRISEKLILKESEKIEYGEVAENRGKADLPPLQ
jgi:hypothetical protein